MVNNFLLWEHSSDCPGSSRLQPIISLFYCKASPCLNTRKEHILIIWCNEIAALLNWNEPLHVYLLRGNICHISYSLEINNGGYKNIWCFRWFYILVPLALNLRCVYGWLTFTFKYFVFPQVFYGSLFVRRISLFLVNYCLFILCFPFIQALSNFF